MGWGLTGCGAAWMKRTWGARWAGSWSWAHGAHCQQWRLTEDWAASATACPVDGGKWFFPFTQHLLDPVRNALSTTGPATTTNMLINWSKASGGPPRCWSMWPVRRGWGNWPCLAWRRDIFRETHQHPSDTYWEDEGHLSTAVWGGKTREDMAGRQVPEVVAISNALWIQC